MAAWGLLGSRTGRVLDRARAGADEEDLLARASWRRQGIGCELHRLLLDGRSEERATLSVSPGATAAQAALRAWGWRKIARSRSDDAGSVRDVMVIDLPWVPPADRKWWDY